MPSSNAELASAYISLIPSFKGAETTITQGMSGMGEAAGTKASGGFLSTIGGVAGKVVSLAAGGVSAVGAIVAGMAIKGGITRQLDIENATAKLEGLGNSTKTVSLVMANALTSVKGTAYGLGDAATVAAGAVAAGIKPGTELTRVLKLVADTSTITGLSMGQTGAIFNKVAASNKLNLGDVNQLTQQGLPILDMLAKKYGVSTAAASKMVTQGKVNFKDFSDAIQTNIGGAALKSGNTTQGAFANMGAALSRVGVMLTSGFFPLFKQIFNQVTTVLDGVTKDIGPFVTSWEDGFAKKATPVIANFANVVLLQVHRVVAAFELMRVGGRITEAMATDFGTSKILFFIAFGNTIRLVAQRIKTAYELIIPNGRITEAMATDFGTSKILFFIAFGNNIRAVADRVKGAFELMTPGGAISLATAQAFGPARIHFFVAFGDGVRAALGGLMSFFKTIGPAIGSIFSGIKTGNFDGAGASLGKTFTALQALSQPLGAVLVAVGQNIGAVAKQLGSLVASSLPLIAPLIQIAANAMGFLARHSGLLVPIIMAVTAAILLYRTGQTAANLAELGALPIKAASVVSQLVLASANRALAISQTATTEGVVANTASRFPAVVQVIIHTAALVAHAVAMTAVRIAMAVATAAQWLFNLAMDANPIGIVILAIVALVAGIILLATHWTQVVSFVTTVWGGFLSWATASLTAFGAWWNSVWSAVFAFVSAVWANISTATQVILAIIVGAIQSNLNNARNIVMSILNAIGSFFTAVFNAYLSTVRTVFSFIVSTVSSQLNTARSVVSSVLNAIGAVFSAVWNSYVSIVRSVLGAIVSVVSGGLNTAGSVVSGALSWIAGLFGGIFGGIVGTVSAGIGRVVGFFSGIGGRISGAIGDVGGILAGIGSSIMGSLLGGLQAAWGAVQNFVGGIAGWIKDHKGPESVDRVLLRPAGQWIMGGLNDSMAGEIPALETTVGQVSDTIRKGITAKATVDLALRSGASDMRSIGAQVMQAGGAGSGPAVNYNGPVYGFDPEEAPKKWVRDLADAAAVAGLRNGKVTL